MHLKKSFYLNAFLILFSCYQQPSISSNSLQAVVKSELMEADNLPEGMGRVFIISYTDSDSIISDDDMGYCSATPISNRLNIGLYFVDGNCGLKITSQVKLFAELNKKWYVGVQAPDSQNQFTSLNGMSISDLLSMAENSKSRVRIFVKQLSNYYSNNNPHADRTKGIPVGAYLIEEGPSRLFFKKSAFGLYHSYSLAAQVTLVWNSGSLVQKNCKLLAKNDQPNKIICPVSSTRSQQLMATDVATVFHDDNHAILGETRATSWEDGRLTLIPVYFEGKNASNLYLMDPLLFADEPILFVGFTGYYEYPKPKLAVPEAFQPMLGNFFDVELLAAINDYSYGDPDHFYVTHLGGKIIGLSECNMSNKKDIILQWGPEASFDQEAVMAKNTFEEQVAMFTKFNYGNNISHPEWGFSVEARISSPIECELAACLREQSKINFGKYNPWNRNSNSGLGQAFRNCGSDFLEKTFDDPVLTLGLKNDVNSD